MSYLTLDEAAQYATHKTGRKVEASELLRAGVHGVLLICAPFGFGMMYNATLRQEEDFRPGLLVIPPSHLFEIETEGSARIQAAHSIDGQTLYFPYQERTRCQLRVLRTSLDRFIPGLIDMPKTLAVTGADIKDRRTTGRRKTDTSNDALRNQIAKQLLDTKTQAELNAMTSKELLAALEAMSNIKGLFISGGKDWLNRDHSVIPRRNPGRKKGN